MSKYLSRGDQDKAHDVLARLQEKDDPDYLRGLFYQYRDKKNKSSEKKDKNREKKDKSVTDLTILHIAATFEKGNLKIVTYLLTEIPSLLYIPREDSYNGQTALHIAVARGNYEIAEAILEKDKSLRKEEPFFFNKEPIHERLADGFRFKNTIVMGQTPLSVAALKGDKRMVDLLIEISHADICQKNTLNETIFHSIIRYAAVHPERETDMQVMCDHLNNKLQVKYSHGHPIWFERNQNNLTALQLAASLGTVNMFGFIVNLKDIYCFQAAHDGLFDIKKYDITEIDSVTWRKAVTLEEESRQENNVCQILGFLFSFIYLFVVITVFIVKTKKPPKSIFMKYSNNFWYLSLLLCFSLCFIIDSSIHWLGQEELTMSGFLIAALIFGWWFLVFFLRAIYHFSFFTELIGRFIFGDLFRFSVVIGFELIAFTAGMSIMFTGRTVEEITSNGTSTTIPDNNFADGIRFNNTIVMGQTPLSVAALKGDKRMVDLLIDKFDADICKKNTLNATIFPSIIRYAAVHPERETDMQVMCEHFNNKQTE
ncbi:hypothetical protein KUTeg_000143 [Tegillarca granosa]|uniref:Uncharacterized protein n=1 Tax=Tegillarca granosa TaxID=220873 RepID=A0ABQ9G052_TEGGR|nr:hypothetical protein KUTeg_000143 [Tegillarca granosa]